MNAAAAAQHPTNATTTMEAVSLIGFTYHDRR